MLLIRMSNNRFRKETRLSVMYLFSSYNINNPLFTNTYISDYNISSGIVVDVLTFSILLSVSPGYETYECCCDAETRKKVKHHDATIPRIVGFIRCMVKHKHNKCNPFGAVACD